MRLRPHQRVSIEVAEARALAMMPRGAERPLPAQEFAAAIWPTHEMKPQGTGAAASRVLKGLSRRGLCRWMHRGSWWGWHG